MSDDDLGPRVARLELAVFPRDSAHRTERPAFSSTDASPRAAFLAWSDLVEIERALISVPASEHTAVTLYRLREELDRGEKLGVFSGKDRGRPHPAPLRRRSAP